MQLHQLYQITKAKQHRIATKSAKLKGYTSDIHIYFEKKEPSTTTLEIRIDDEVIERYETKELGAHEYHMENFRHTPYPYSITKNLYFTFSGEEQPIQHALSYKYVDYSPLVGHAIRILTPSTKIKALGTYKYITIKARESAESIEDTAMISCDNFDIIRESIMFKKTAHSTYPPIMGAHRIMLLTMCKTIFDTYHLLVKDTDCDKTLNALTTTYPRYTFSVVKDRDEIKNIIASSNKLVTTLVTALTKTQ